MLVVLLDHHYGGVYTDWDIDQLADTPRGMYKTPANGDFMRQAGIEPATSRSGGARSIP